MKPEPLKGKRKKYSDGCTLEHWHKDDIRSAVDWFKESFMNAKINGKAIKMNLFEWSLFEQLLREAFEDVMK